MTNNHILLSNPQLRKVIPNVGPATYQGNGRREIIPADLVCVLKKVIDPNFRPDDTLYIGTVGKDHYCSVYQGGADSNATVILWETKTQSLRGCLLDPKTRSKRAIETVVAKKEFEARPMWAVLLAAAGEKDGTFSTVEDYIKSFSDLLLCGAAVRDAMDMTLPRDGNISLMTDKDIKLVEMSMPLCGTIPWEIKTDTQVKARLTMGDLMQMSECVAFRSRLPKWDGRAQEYMSARVFPDDYPVPEEAKMIIQIYLATYDDPNPIKNFMLRGETAAGKSTICQIVAQALGLPRAVLKGHTRLTFEDATSKIMVKTGSDTTAPVTLTIEDITNDPEGAYEQLTGKFPDNEVSPQEVFQMYMERVQNGSSGYYLESSPFIQALAGGWLCEIMEASRIRDKGMLVGLNDYCQPGSLIQMADGSLQKRHDRSIVIFTDNKTYDTCQEMEGSVKRRIAFVLDIDNLDKDTILERCRYNTRAVRSEEPLLQRCFSIWSAVRKYAEEHGYTDASVSPEELERMFQLVRKFPGDDSWFQKIVYSTLLAKVCTQPDELSDLKEWATTIL